MHLIHGQVFCIILDFFEMWTSLQIGYNQLFWNLRFKLLKSCTYFALFSVLEFFFESFSSVWINSCSLYCQFFSFFLYYASPSRPEGPRRFPDRGNAGGALVFLDPLWLLYALGVYTLQENWCGQIRILSKFYPPKILRPKILTPQIFGSVYIAGKLVLAK